MAGIEEAFKKFVTRISSKEEPQEELAYKGLANGGLTNFIKNNIAPEYRLYTRTMVPGLKTGRLDEEYFPDDFKLDLRKQALDKYAKTGELSGIVDEMDQHTSRGKINKLIKYPSTYAALGTYSYEIDPKTLDVKVKDKYDWNPAYGTKGNFTGWVGNEPEKGGRDVDASMLKDYAVNTMKRGIDIPAGLELLGNLLGPRASKGEGVDIDINIPTEFAAMRADTPYALGGPALKTIKPTQKEIDDFVNQPIPIGQMIPVNEFLPGEDYATYVRRKRAETGPLLFAGEPVTTPSTPQINISTNPIAKSLEMAGFTKEEIMKIIGEKGYAYGGLTKTVPPVSGPDPQGVESLFKRRYN